MLLVNQSKKDVTLITIGYDIVYLQLQPYPLGKILEGPTLNHQICQICLCYQGQQE